jgi:hypothetical protein
LFVPEVGMVIRYAYLWADEDATGRDEASKDRPTLVLAVAVAASEVMVLAITHSRPTKATDAVPFPAHVKADLGLDDDPAWIVTTEANAFIWPGPDIRPVPNRKPSSPIYGKVPASVLKQVAISYLANRKRQSRMVKRQP